MSQSIRVAVVTGAASGIGRAVAGRLARDGARVLLADMAEPAGAAAAAELSAVGLAARFVALDVREPAAADAAVAAAADWGGLHAWVNCAGVMHNASIFDETDEGWARIIDTNLKGAFVCSRAAMRWMRDRGGGNVVNIASVTGLMGYQALAAYCASKGGVLALTRALAMDGAPHGIRVNCLCPGTTATQILDDFLSATPDPAKSRAAFAAIHPLGRIATPEEIAGVVAFALSEDAAFMTGASLVVDGGFTIHGVQPRL